MQENEIQENETIEASQRRFDSRLIPILREGIEIVRMVFYKELKGVVAEKYPDLDEGGVRMLCGACLNTVFGALNTDVKYVEFCKAREQEIAECLDLIPAQLEHLRIPLTDALRMMILCDHQEGAADTTVLAKAKSMGVLLEDRAMPMPNSFIELVRRLGAAYRLVQAPQDGAH